MLYGTIINNVKKVNILQIPWMMEVIEERFDDIMSIIDSKNIIYGGVLRDIVAGKKLLGDIDILVRREDLKNIIQMFDNCSRWVRSKNGVITDGYNGDRIETIHSSISYTNTNGNVAQLIIPENRSDRIKQKLINKSRRNLPPSISKSINNYSIGPAQPEFTTILENTDIVCCGLFCDVFGTIYEIIDGAIDDCRDGLIRLNENSIFNKSTRNIAINRVKKLVEKGWIWTYDMSIENKIDERIKESENG